MLDIIKQLNFSRTINNKNIKNLVNSQTENTSEDNSENKAKKIRTALKAMAIVGAASIGIGTLIYRQKNLKHIVSDSKKSMKDALSVAAVGAAGIAGVSTIQKNSAQPAQQKEVHSLEETQQPKSAKYQADDEQIPKQKTARKRYVADDNIKTKYKRNYKTEDGSRLTEFFINDEIKKVMKTSYDKDTKSLYITETKLLDSGYLQTSARIADLQTGTELRAEYANTQLSNCALYTKDSQLIKSWDLSADTPDEFEETYKNFTNELNGCGFEKNPKKQEDHLVFPSLEEVPLQFEFVKNPKTNKLELYSNMIQP